MVSPRCASIMVVGLGWAWASAGPPPTLGLEYPEGTAVPRHATDAERAWLAVTGGLAPQAVVTPPPTGPVHCVAEYEPVEGLLIAWEGDTSWKSILASMAGQITTTGNAKVFCVLDSSAEQSSASSTLSAAGTNMSRVQFVVRTTDTIWIRDYGPRFIYQGDCRAIVDHTYNRPRPNDDAFPPYFAGLRKHPFYELQLVHGGGNYHLDALGRSFATRLINNENPGLTETQIHDIWQDYQGVDTSFFTPFPTSVDLTQHIDMWMQVVADDRIVISDWPNNPGSTQDTICDNAAATLAARGYAITRVPARLVGGVHYTFTNVVMCNDLVLIPSYTNASVSGHNATALANWQTACPGKTIVPINCEAIVSAAGVMHCIVMHVPVHRGGGDPTAYLTNLNGGEALDPADLVEIQWISDDDVAVTNVDLLLSLDGGATFPTVIATATADDGAFTWTVPDVFSTTARVRVVARDAAGHTGSDDSDADFVINGVPPVTPGDVNCDGVIDSFDIGAFVLAITDASAYASAYPLCDIAAADCDGDGSLTSFDIAAFVALLTP